ncbi:MAG: hypothetical protein HYR91_09040 [Flavobacteriia bacterium]|nr:hypothetical protein [Flavobacteriia bacterium]
MFQKSKEIIGHSAAIYCGIFHLNQLYSGSADKYVTRWNIENGLQDKFAINLGQSVYSIVFISENLGVIGLSNGSVHIIDIFQKIEVKHFTQHLKGIFALENNSIKKHFYCGDADGNLSVWDSENLSLLIYLPLNCGKIRKIKCSKEGNLLVLSCQDGSIRVFETKGFNEIKTIEKAHKGGTSITVFHPTQNVLISGGKDAKLKIWDFDSEKLMLEIPAHHFVIYDLLFVNDDNQFISVSRDKTIKIWDSQSFGFIQRLDLKTGGHKHSINGLVKISENKFATFGDDKKILIWEHKS